MAIGETDLMTLLASMSPELMEGDYVFCTFPGAKYGDHANFQPIAMMQETEGLTLILPRTIADAEKLSYNSVFKGITLTVHSSLDAVGLTAAFAEQLADSGISANVVAGFYHDHIFVQSEQADMAILALKALSKQ